MLGEYDLVHGFVEVFVVPSRRRQMFPAECKLNGRVRWR